MLPRLLTLLLALVALPAFADTDTDALTKAVTFYASFDDDVKGDAGGGRLTLSTRKGDLKTKKFTAEKGFSDKAFRIAKGKGIAGGALDCVDVLPDNGRIFFPAKGNIAYRKGGWAGSVAMWIKTDPNKLLKTKFCDPVQITQKGANDGGLWFDFNDNKPRDLRMGVFAAVPAGKKGVQESDPDAPLIWLRKVNFSADDWHHVVMTWKNLDTGKPDAHARLLIDGKLIGELKERELGMAWDIDKAGIYLAINYIGLLDEFAVFDRVLTDGEVKMLREKPDVLAAVKKRKR